MQVAWLTFAESRRQPETEKILKDHVTDAKATVSVPDLGNCFSPLEMQQINQPDAKDERVEMHVLPCTPEDSHQIQLKFRAKGVRPMSLTIRGQIGTSVLGPRGCWGLGRLGNWVHWLVFALVLLHSTPVAQKFVTAIVCE